jgi:ATP-dependent exoDNAse (exonuclease V), alpha subunit - helicase superfamily I member
LSKKEKIKLKLKPTFQIFPRNGAIEKEDQFYVYSCYACEPNDQIEVNPDYQTFVIAGKIQKLELNQEYTATVTKADRPFSYDVVSIFQELPSNGLQQREFFRALLTERQFKALYDTYGTEVDLIKMFQNDEIDISKVHGFGEETYRRVKEKIIKNLDYQVLISELSKYGITFSVIVKLIELYGNADYAAKKIKEQPYSLTKIDGIGFIKADTIAKNMKEEDLKEKIESGEISKEQARDLYINGIFKNPERIKEGIKYAVKENQNNGHTFMYIEELIDKCKELLQISDENLLYEQIDSLMKNKVIYYDGDRVATKEAYETEKEIALWFAEKLSDKATELDFDIDEFIEGIERENNIQLTHQQKHFFFNVKHYGVHLLVGYAGVGKSQMQKFLRDLCDELNLTVKWLAPTGAAAKVLSNYVNRDASTVHKAIGYGRKNYDSDDDQPSFEGSSGEIHEDYIVVDETSMLDIFVLDSLLKKIKNPKARLLFIGDSFQIPSVAAGNLLHDMIESQIIPVTKLDIVFRQKEGGALDVATKIRLGESFLDRNSVGEYEFGKDFIVNCIEQEQMVEMYKYYYQDLINVYGSDNVMVLSSRKTGDLGTQAINYNVQQIVNPQLPFDKLDEIEYNENIVFRVNDYVMNIKNTYDVMTIDGKTIDLVNGDKGKIIKVNKEHIKKNKSKIDDMFEGTEIGLIDRDDMFENGDSDMEMTKKGVYVEFDEGVVHFTPNLLNQLMHTWALTIHKSQGSGSDVVLIIVDKSHTYQMNANLLYTAITRLRKFGVLLCQPEVINRSIKKVANLTRNTFLQELLKNNI